MKEKKNTTIKILCVCEHAQENPSQSTNIINSEFEPQTSPFYDIGTRRFQYYTEISLALPKSECVRGLTATHTLIYEELTNELKKEGDNENGQSVRSS